MASKTAMHWMVGTLPKSRGCVLRLSPNTFAHTRSPHRTAKSLSKLCLRLFKIVFEIVWICLDRLLNSIEVHNVRSNRLLVPLAHCICHSHSIHLFIFTCSLARLTYSQREAAFFENSAFPFTIMQPFYRGALSSYWKVKKEGTNGTPCGTNRSRRRLSASLCAFSKQFFKYFRISK